MVKKNGTEFVTLRNGGKMKEIRVAIIGGGMISHRHMVIYSNIQRNAEKLGFTAKVVAVAEVVPERLKAWGGNNMVWRKRIFTPIIVSF